MGNQSLAIFEFEKPLIYVNFTGNPATDQNVEEYIQLSHKAFEWERYGLIYDVSKMNYLPAKYRIMQGNDLERIKKEVKNQAIGLAIIAPSFLQRTLVQAIFFIKSYPSELKVCRTKEEAMNWMNKLLDKEDTNTQK
jgi:hypothetical protein